MLKQMRSGAQSVVLKLFLFGLLLMAMLGLAVIDVQGMFTSGFKSKSVATIDGDKLTTTEFDQLLQTALRRQQMPADQAWATGYPAQYLQNEINSRMLSKNVRDLGLIVSNEEAAKQLKRMLEPLTGTGMDKKEALQGMLYNMGVSEGQLVETMKVQIGLDTLMKAITSGIKAPPQMAQDAIRFRAESRRGEYFTLTAEDAGELEEPDDKTLADYYKKISKNFVIPEMRTIAVLVVDAKSLGLDVEPTEADAKKWYEDHKDSYAIGERRVISQIVVPKQEDADKLYALTKTEKDLKKLSTGAGKGISTFVRSGDYTEQEVPTDLSGAFKAEPGTVLEPVKTPLGYLIAKVEEVKPPTTRSFDDAKDDILRDLANAQDSATAMDKKANEIEDLIAGGKSLDDIAKELNLKLTVLDNVKAADAATAKIPGAEQVFAEAFRLDKGAPSQRIDAPTGEFMIAEVREVTPEAEQPLEKVRSDVVKTWRQEQQGTLIDQATTKILDRLKLGEDFAAVAKSLGKQVQRTSMLSRGEYAQAQSMQKGVFPALFALDKVGQVTAVGAGPEGATILRLAERRIDATKEAKKEELDKLAAMLDHAVQKDLLEQYRLALIRKYDVEINHAALEEMQKARNAADEGVDGLN
ncbi:MAG TPA: peptidyl-prolyl cis-trans isomerase [Patescibacteria group bacterium]|nr:peptidyl-prolyl cis-trans isomerase [Patescibacteria group bacterium]